MSNKYESTQCTRCGRSNFVSFCKNCGDLEAHDDAIRRECRIHYEKILNDIASLHEKNCSEYDAYKMMIMARAAILGTEPAREESK